MIHCKDFDEPTLSYVEAKDGRFMVRCIYGRNGKATELELTIHEAPAEHPNDWCRLTAFETGDGAVDVYVFVEDGLANVCIRFGDASGEHLDMGTVMDFLTGDVGRHHQEVASLLLKRMDFFCEIKEQQ